VHSQLFRSVLTYENVECIGKVICHAPGTTTTTGDVNERTMNRAGKQTAPSALPRPIKSPSAAPAPFHCTTELPSNLNRTKIKIEHTLNQQLQDKRTANGEPIHYEYQTVRTHLRFKCQASEASTHFRNYLQCPIKCSVLCLISDRHQTNAGSKLVGQRKRKGCSQFWTQHPKPSAPHSRQRPNQWRTQLFFRRGFDNFVKMVDIESSFVNWNKK